MDMTTIKQTIAANYTAEETDTTLTVGGISVQERPVLVQVQPDPHFQAAVTLTQDGHAVRLPLYQWRELAPYVERGIARVTHQPMSKEAVDAHLAELRAVLADDTTNTTTGSK